MSAISSRPDACTSVRGTVALSIVLAVPGPALAPGQAEALVALVEGRLGMRCEALLAFGGDEPPAELPGVVLRHAPGCRDLGTLYDAGVRAAAGRFVLLLDGSAMPDAAGLVELVRFAETSQWIGALVPRYLGADGRDRPAGQLFPSLARIWRRVEPSPCPRQTTPTAVEAARAGCVLLRRQAVLDAGGFEAGWPAGGELLDWCKRMRARGWTVFHHPGVVATLAGDARESGPAVRAAIARRFVRRHEGRRQAMLVRLLQLVRR